VTEWEVIISKSLEGLQKNSKKIKIIIFLQKKKPKLPMPTAKPVGCATPA
jgi:hypothetical protein